MRTSILGLVLFCLAGCASQQPEEKPSGLCRLEILEKGCPTILHVGDPGAIEPVIRLTGNCSTVVVRGFIDATDHLGVPVGQTQVSTNERVPESGCLAIPIPDRLIERAGAGGKLKIRLSFAPGDTSNRGEEINEMIEVLGR
ncbi:MAG: hypothetical protein K8T20_18075 [Planctomycetes bacterium]|nr:hypothetical protein [Planctomycetota bacterium]